jgi:hypothetical protein
MMAAVRLKTPHTRELPGYLPILHREQAVHAATAAAAGAHFYIVADFAG